MTKLKTLVGAIALGLSMNTLAQTGFVEQAKVCRINPTTDEFIAYLSFQPCDFIESLSTLSACPHTDGLQAPELILFEPRTADSYIKYNIWTLASLSEQFLDRTRMNFWWRYDVGTNRCEVFHAEFVRKAEPAESASLDLPSPAAQGDKAGRCHH